MSAEQAASAGVISEVTPSVTTESTAITPVTPTETTSTSVMDKLGVPESVQVELAKRKKTEPENVPQPEPAPEPESTPETQPEENPEPEQPVAEKDVWPESAKKRVDRVTRQREEWKEKAEQAADEAARLKAQLDSSQPVTVAPTPSDVLANVQTPEQVEQAVSEARLARDWYRQHPNGVTLDEGKPSQRFMEPEEIAARLGEAEDVIMIHAPAKRQQIQARQEFDSVARVKYPNLFDRGSEDYQIGVNLMRRFPSIANDPARNMMIGDYLRGARDRLAEESKVAKPSKDIPEQLLRPQPPIAPSVPATARTDNGTVPSRKREEEAMNRLVKEGAEDGNTSALAAVIRARREAKKRSGNSLVTA